MSRKGVAAFGHDRLDAGTPAAQHLELAVVHPVIILILRHSYCQPAAPAATACENPCSLPRRRVRAVRHSTGTFPLKQDTTLAAQRHTQHARGREKLLGHLAMLLFSVLIAGSFSFGGLATQHMAAGPLTLWRYLLTMAVLGLLTFGIMRVPFRFPAEVWRFVTLGGLIALYMLTMFKALEFTNPVSTGAVFTLMPLMSAGFAFLLLGQHTRPGVMAGLIIAALGAVWVIFRADIAAILAFDVGRGELIYFFGVVCHAIYVPLLRKFDRKENPLAFGFWVAVFTIPWLLVPGAVPLAKTDFAALPAVVWIAVAYLAVVTTAFTFLLLQYASLRLPSSKVLGYGYLTPTFIILLEGILGHGWVTLPIMLGALTTACGLLLMALLPD
ncbi:DMT family transporter [Pararhizobium sp.]|uniref:DMT family transporter n=1 Tax=Pararhizobium sp. TaxID=1977563 RepID=UPI002727B2BC|nr:DMT family transporter [Pararhizobium sp.]MDO9414991.1 DMT family transporter [Pararhizobium sp.]